MASISRKHHESKKDSLRCGGNQQLSLRIVGLAVVNMYSASAFAPRTVGNGEIFYARYTNSLSSENAYTTTDGNTYAASEDG